MKKQEQEQQPAARVCGPQRGVPLLITVNVEQALPATHPMRGVWQVVSALDWGAHLSRFRARVVRRWIRARWRRCGFRRCRRGLSRRGRWRDAVTRITPAAGRWAGDGESSHAVGLLRQDCWTLDALLSQTDLRFASERGGVV